MSSVYTGLSSVLTGHKHVQCAHWICVLAGCNIYSCIPSYRGAAREARADSVKPDRNFEFRFITVCLSNSEKYILSIVFFK